MPARDARYVQIGTNSGGDAVYGLRGARPTGDLPKTGNKDELIERLQESDG
jgi:hypothetical protein